MKKIFLICPIGDSDSIARKRSDDVLAYVVKPIASLYKYEVLRGDQTANPAVITTDIINNLIESDIVIADLTDHNPNVYYELGIRHALRKPVIQMIQKGQTVPFDVRQIRTIEFDPESVPSVNECHTQIGEAIRIIEESGGKVDNPISIILDINALHQDTTPFETSLNEIITLLEKSSLTDDKYTQILSYLENIFTKIGTTSESQNDIKALEKEIAEYKRTHQGLFHEIRFTEEKASLYKKLYEEQLLRTNEIFNMMIGNRGQTLLPEKSELSYDESSNDFDDSNYEDIKNQFEEKNSLGSSSNEVSEEKVDNLFSHTHGILPP